MKYFTKDEAKRIISNQPMGICFVTSNNPNAAAMRGLSEIIDTSIHKKDAYFMACTGFVLGRATGIREERARRRKQI